MKDNKQTTPEKSIPEKLSADFSGNGADPISEILKAAELDQLKKNDSLSRIEQKLRLLLCIITEAKPRIDPLRLSAVREAAIQRLEKLDIRSPARLVDAALATKDGPDKGEPPKITLEDPEPWPDPIDGNELLTGISSMIRRFVILPRHGDLAVTLWILAGHALDAFDISPILAITSPTKRAGKSLLLEILGELVPCGLSVSNITAAALFRAVEAFKPTLLIDEADTFLASDKTQKNGQDELRGILNASHKKASAFVIRNITSGDDHQPAIFSTWCPKAIALIGKLPATLEDRSIVVSMKRKALGENVDRFRRNHVQEDLRQLKRKAIRWAQDHMIALKTMDPQTPAELNDRAADNWRPLLAIADLIKRQWPESARKAAVALAAESDEAENTAGVQLLGDIHDIFIARRSDPISSADLVEQLATMEDRPWPEWRARKPITQRQLARLLAPFKISPTTIRFEEKLAKGYRIDMFSDAFRRYLSVTPLQSAASGGINDENSPETRSVTESPVTDRSADLSARYQDGVTHVTDEKPKLGWEEDI